MSKILDAPELIPGSGLGPIHFGIAPEEVMELLGPPAERRLAENDETSSLDLEYPSGACFFFHREDGWQLTSIEVDASSEALLFGEPLFPGSREHILALLQRRLSLDSKDFILHRKEYLDEIRITIPSLRTTFYFDLDDNLQHVHWGVFFNPADEIVWPHVP